MRIEKYFACPVCKTSISSPKTEGKCPKCGFEYKNKDGIWRFINITDEQTKSSAKKYNFMHNKKFDGPKDGSYEILAAIARGNKTIDIACGDGEIESLSGETIGVEFSLNALKKASRNGAKFLVHADAQNLPFKDNSFDVAICSGSLEHFNEPQKALDEMARVATIQVLTVHRPIAPFAERIYGLVKHQPIEKPIEQSVLEQMLKKANLHIIFKGVWTLPVNYGRPIKILPEMPLFPCCTFVMSIKKSQI